MNTFTNTSRVPAGVYVSLNPPDVRHVGADGEELVGMAGAAYRRIPNLWVVALGPVLGGAFVLLFPVMMVVGIGIALGSLVVRQVRSATEQYAYLARVGWEPSAAFLNKRADHAEPGTDASLQALKEETERKKAQEDAAHHT